ncbi:hypothetical protein IGI04_042272 [Brassica rapa subsp. trilocularis]|uniref:Uncharacterized protein n=1 Tax=Brassica rapa subsp. trilocularis TaxID=1813537 RepID=A0ABQ7KIR3_BRACM|nr:hypothetical protein IGI04_042272 [Brassica rapa subsp. trilocularis]
MGLACGSARREEKEERGNEWGWFSQMKTTLKRCGVWRNHEKEESLKGKAAEKDQTARETSGNCFSLEESTLLEKIEDVYENKISLRRVYEVKKVISGGKPGREEFNNHVRKLQHLWVELQGLRSHVDGDTTQEQETVLKLLASMESSYGWLVEMVLRGEQLPEMEEICGLIRRAYEIMRDDERLTMSRSESSWKPTGSRSESFQKLTMSRSEGSWRLTGSRSEGFRKKRSLHGGISRRQWGVKSVEMRALWYEEETLGSVEALERKMEASCTDCTDRVKGTDDQAVPSCAAELDPNVERIRKSASDSLARAGKSFWVRFKFKTGCGVSSEAVWVEDRGCEGFYKESSNPTSEAERTTPLDHERGNGTESHEQVQNQDSGQHNQEVTQEVESGAQSSGDGQRESTGSDESGTQSSEGDGSNESGAQSTSLEKLGHDQIIFTTLVRLINTSHTACPLHRTGLDLPLSTDFTAFLEKLGNDQMSSHSAIAPSPWHHQLLGKAEWIHQLLINHFTIEAALINSPSSLEPRLEGAKLVMIICIPMELGCLNHHRETHKTHFSLHNDPCYTSCSLWTGYVQWYYAMAISHCIINHTTLPVDYGLTCPIWCGDAWPSLPLFGLHISLSCFTLILVMICNGTRPLSLHSWLLASYMYHFPCVPNTTTTQCKIRSSHWDQTMIIHPV